MEHNVTAFEALVSVASGGKWLVLALLSQIEIFVRDPTLLRELLHRLPPSAKEAPSASVRGMARVLVFGTIQHY